MIEKAVHYGGRSVVKACLDGRISCVIEACSDSLLAVRFFMCFFVIMQRNLPLMYN